MALGLSASIRLAFRDQIILQIGAHLAGQARAMLLKKLTRYEREVVDFALLSFFPLLLSLNFVI